MEEFRYKVGESDHATTRECEDGGILSSGSNYIAKWAEVKAAAWEKIIAVTFLLGADRRQYRG